MTAKPHRRSGPSPLLPAATLAAAQTRGLTTAEQAIGADAADTFVQTLGGRAAFVDILACGSGSAEVEGLLALLDDPRYDRIPLKTLCRQANLTVVEVFQAFKTAALARAQIQAVAQITAALPAVVEDLLRRAAPYEAACATCAGVGTTTAEPSKTVPNPAPQPCEACHGTGKQTYLPDLERQKVALELAELLKKGGGISILQQQNTLALGDPSSAGYVGLQQALARGLAAPLLPDRPEVDDATGDTTGPVVEGSVVGDDPVPPAPSAPADV